MCKSSLRDVRRCDRQDDERPLIDAGVIESSTLHRHERSVVARISNRRRALAIKDEQMPLLGRTA